MATPCRLASVPSAAPFSASKRNGTPSQNDDKPKLQFSRLQEAICSSGGKMTVAQRAAMLESPAIGKFGFKHRLEQDSQKGKENAAENNSTANAFSFWGSASKKPVASNSNMPEFMQRNNKIPRTLKFDSPQKNAAVSNDSPAKPLVSASPIKVSMNEKSPETRKPLTPLSVKTHHPNTSPFRRMQPAAMQQPTTLPEQDTGRESWLPPPPKAEQAEETIMPLPPALMQTEAIGFSLSAAVVGGPESGKKRKSSELYELSQTTHGTASNKTSEDASFMTARGEEEAPTVDVQGDVVMHFEESAVADQNVFCSRPEGSNPTYDNIAANLTREVQYEPSMEMDAAEETLVAEDGVELQCCVLQMHTKRSIEKCVESVIHDVLASKPDRSIISNSGDSRAIQDMAADVSRKVSQLVAKEQRQSSASTASSASSGDGDASHNQSNAQESLNSSGGEASLTEEEVQRLREEVRRARELKQQQMQTPQRAIAEQTPARIQGQPPIQGPAPAAPQAEEGAAEEHAQEEAGGAEEAAAAGHATPGKGPGESHLLERRPLVGDDKPVVRDIDAEVRSAKKAAKPIIEPDLQKKLAARSAEVNQGQEDISYAASKIDVEVRSAKKAPKPIIDDDLQAKLAARRRWERMSMMSGHSASPGGEEHADADAFMLDGGAAGDECLTEAGSSTRSLFTPCKVPDAVVVPANKDRSMLAEKLAARRKWERENSASLSRSSPAVRRDQGALRAPPAAQQLSDSPFKVAPWQAGAAERGPADEDAAMDELPAPEEAADAAKPRTEGVEDSVLGARLAQRREWEAAEEEGEPEAAEGGPSLPASVVFKDGEVNRSGTKESEARSLTEKEDGLDAKLAQRREWEQRLSEMSQASIVMDRSLERGEVAEAEPERVLASAILDLKELCSTMENDHAELQLKYSDIESELAKTKEQVRHCASKEQIQHLQDWLKSEIKMLEEADTRPQPAVAPAPAAAPAAARAGPADAAFPRDGPRKVRCGGGQCVIS